MTRIRCRERGCVFNKRGVCSSEEIEYEPDAGCLTMEPRDDVKDDEEDWEEEDGELREADEEDEEEEEQDEKSDEDEY